MEALIVQDELLTQLGIPYLSDHFGLFLGSCIGFLLIQLVSHLIFPLLLPTHFSKFSRETKLNWDIHFAGWIHALVVTPLCIYFIFNPSPALAGSPIFGYAPAEGTLYALSAGYFACDLLQASLLVRTHGVQYLLHAFACCFIFYKAFSPFLMGIGVKFLVWEFSTIFLHIHWALDKFNMTGSTYQLVNGVFLVATFFGGRIVYGLYNTAVLWSLLEDPAVEPGTRWGIRLANLSLAGLNVLWFGLMLAALRKRFTVKEGQDARKEGPLGIKTGLKIEGVPGSVANGLKNE